MLPTHGALFWLMVGVAIVVFVAVEALLVASALRYRPSTDSLSDGYRRAGRLAELWWTLLPAILLALLLALSFRALPAAS